MISNTKRFSIWLVLAFIVVVFSFLIISFSVASTPISFAETVDATETGDTTTIDEVNTTVKEWVSLIVNVVTLITTSGIFALFSKNKKQTVSVNVNDQTTQQKLNQQFKEFSELKELVTALLVLQKGTVDTITALFADNPSLDEAVRAALKDVSDQAKVTVKQVKKVMNSEKEKQVGDVIKNITLG